MRKRYMIIDVTADIMFYVRSVNDDYVISSYTYRAILSDWKESAFS